MMALGFAAAAIPLHLLLRRELRETSEDIRKQGWPIRMIEVLFLRYVLRWFDVEGLENLPAGSYLLASNHPYRSGVDGFLLGHLLATKAGRVPRIVITGEARNWAVTAERWVLYHYGIALLAPDPSASRAKRRGLTDIIAGYLRETASRSVIIFPAGRAARDPEEQLKGWSTGVIVCSQKSGCPIVPVAIGGPPLDATPESILVSSLHGSETHTPFRVHVRIGKPFRPEGELHAELDKLRSEVAELMKTIPDLQNSAKPAPPRADDMREFTLTP